MELLLGKSRAGHDKDRIYVITGTKENMYICVDGKYRCTNNPKVKKQKHIQIIKHFSKQVQDICKEIKVLDDDNIRRILKNYNKYENKEN